MKRVDTELLNKRIDESGLKKVFLAEQLGITTQALNDKINGKTPFRKSEIFVLCYFTGITDNDEKAKIFFPER